MKAIAITPMAANSARLVDAPLPTLHEHGVLVRVIRCGICGTDTEINQGLYGQAPTGSDYLILGHENLGRVEQVGLNVRAVKPGDVVVATVRRPDDCLNCSHGESDMCLKGDYVERGIKQLHGFLAEYYLEVPEYLIHVPSELVDVAVLLEPLTIVEKGLWQAYKIQERLMWEPQTAVVFGAGTVGLLAALALRAKGLNVSIVARSPRGTLNSQIAEAAGVQYISSQQVPADDLPKKLGRIDIIFEATGSSLVAMKTLEILGTNGISILSSVTGGGKRVDFPADVVNQRFVLGNMLAFGTVNANRRYFDMGVRSLAQFQNLWPGLLMRFITRRVQMKDFTVDVLNDRQGVKTTIEIGLQ
jgi:threonine dehydrogenase-like Zn-dependent dehydrogenase